jgi:O-antigen ligase
LSSIALIVIAFLQLHVSSVQGVDKWRLMPPPQYIPRFLAFFKQKSWFCVGILFFLAVISFGWSSDVGYWWNRVRLYLPFLSLPMAFWLLPKFSEKRYQTILLASLIAGVFWALVVLTRYFLHFDKMNKKLLMGQPIATPIDHVCFNFALVMSLLCGVALFRQTKSSSQKYRVALIFSLLFLFVTIHILAVRGGILAMYVCIFYLILQYIASVGNWKMGVSACLGIVLVATLAIQFTPSLRNRIQFMVWDWQQAKLGNSMNNSDSERLISLKIGVKMVQQSPILGIGAGDMRTVCNQLYAQHYPQLDAKLPHSQFLMVAAANGLVGLFVFLICFWLPVFSENHYKQPFFVATHLLFFVSFFFEALSEASLSVVLFSFWIGLQLNQFKKE